MLILFGTLGLLQNTILPGLILMKTGKVKGGIAEKLLYLLPISLISNYLLIFLLASLHLYTRPVMTGIIIAEILFILWLYRKTLLKPVGSGFSAFSDVLKRELSPLTGALTSDSLSTADRLKNWIWLISGCFALSGILWGFHLCRLNFGTVFKGWDTLFSWNRYAQTWAEGGIPGIEGMYPQLIPANWSLSYLLQGANPVQFFNTLLPPVFFLIIEVTLFSLGFERRESGFFLAAIIARYMMKKLMGDQLFDGYMDVPAAAMSLMSVYTFMKAEGKDLSKQKQAVILGTIFAAGAATTKQSGFPALVLAPLSAAVLLSDGVRSLNRKQKILLCAAVLLIVLPWYLHCMLYNTHGYERELIANGIRDYNTRFDLRFRLGTAVNTLGKYGICFLLSLIGLPFIQKRYRLLLSLYIWPLTLIWASFYSYDARNLGAVLPFAALACGLALAGIGSAAGHLAQKLRMEQVPLAVFALLCAAAAIVLLVRFFPDNKLTEAQNKQQKTLFGERLNNELLYDILGESHSGYDIYTDYPAWFLSGYEECCTAAELTDTYQVRTVLEQDKVNWLLLPVVLPNDTDPSKELFEQCIAEGKCEEIRCSDGYYKAYCLYQVHR